MNGSVHFDPLLPWPVIAVLGVIALGAVLFALWRGLSGWAWRGLATIALLGALAGPSWRSEDRRPLPDIVVMIEDKSASQGLSDRSEQTGAAAQELAERIEARPDTELRRITVGDGDGEQGEDEGTLLMGALAQALAELPRGRIAGIIALSDGQVHDADRAPPLPAPLHLLLTGHADDWDRRLAVSDTPSFAIIGEPVRMRLRVEDSGAAPEGAGSAPVDISLNGGEPRRFNLPVGEDIEVPVTLARGGRNVIELRTPEVPGELTARNNTRIVQINGVRDRLRVLLVSGEPHAGGRTWRNLLKSDSSVDLVHFTILRPPDKHDGVPVEELSLIAFPTYELFMEKIDDFDLIIFDRYKRRGILPPAYFANVANYARNGGAVLVAAGPEFAGPDSIWRSPLGAVLPAGPTARVIERSFRPAISDTGARHPVTEGLEGAGTWGPWLRQIEVSPDSGEVLMEGANDLPLLVLDRVEDGRVALLASDQAWLWGRGYKGGGPQLDLLRRLAHWLMKEPELEEEALTAQATGQHMRITRRTLGDGVGAVTVTAPGGESAQVTLEQVAPGRFEADYEGAEIGLYRLREGEQEAVIGLGPEAPKEFEQTIATGEVLDPVIAPMRGGILRLEDGLPRIRDVREGAAAAGRGWIGLTPRGAYETTELRQHPLLPPWAMLLLAGGLILAGWLREGRR
ncbi:hypothetical protein [Pontibaca methylaminivorans]|uniref:Uncharacterized membrane protein n=1 Tax=Pontibaca methylaminivorans TaxID=515897 RepID=A0A1R3WX17_9RHOB|nr:hypothetical protein [Pontibaca methylaminivorans]SIT81385.1 Uncharacterized membrane protein [Pontibaca methylaminivorans]